MWDSVETIVQTYGCLAVFGIMAFGVVGMPFPEETLMLFAGFLAHEGKMPLPLVYAAGILGAAVGKFMSYYLGRTIGVHALGRWGGWLGVTEERLLRTEGWFRRGGRWILMFGYFAPMFRHLTALVAGSARLDKRTFALYAMPGAVIWGGFYVTLGYYAGAAWRQVGGKVNTLFFYVAAAVIVLLVAAAAWFVARRLRAKRS
jgi:membrane protein DedA with SNARE-associated domain